MEETFEKNILYKEEFLDLLKGMEKTQDQNLSCFNFLKRKVPLQIAQIRIDSCLSPPFWSSKKKETFLLECQNQCMEMVKTASNLADQFDSFNEMLDKYGLH